MRFVLGFLILLSLPTLATAAGNPALPDADGVVTAADIEKITGIAMIAEDHDTAKEGLRFDSADQKFAFNLMFMPEGFELETMSTETSKFIGDLAEGAYLDLTVGPGGALTFKKGEKVVVIQVTNLKGVTPPITSEQLMKLARIAAGRL